jgi:TonB family protein
MKKFYLFLAILCFQSSLFAQNTADTTIYNIAERQPSFPGCNYDWYSDKQKDSCRFVNLTRFLSNNLRYPNEARDKNISGRVVVRFVVEKDGSLSGIKVLRDIGGGCGEEAVRIIGLMNTAGIKWNPGLIKDQAVRVSMALPVVFKLEEDPGYSIVDGYPVYYLLDKPLKLKDTTVSLNALLSKNLVLPKIINDSCKTGVIQTEILVFPDATAKVIQLDDFSNLGTDAQFEAIQAVTKTAGAWIPAEFKGKVVPTNKVARIIFKPNLAKCKAASLNFEKAYILMQEGVTLSDQKEDTKALEKFNEAIKNMPNNMEFLYLRGILHMNLNKKEEACSDLTRVKATLNANWVDNLLPLLCK